LIIIIKVTFDKSCTTFTRTCTPVSLGACWHLPLKSEWVIETFFMTSEERMRMKWLCLLIHEEEDEQTSDHLIEELEKMLAMRRLRLAVANSDAS